MNGRLVSDLCPKEEYSCFVEIDEVLQCGGVPAYPSEVCKECGVRIPITGRVVLDEVGLQNGTEQMIRIRKFPQWTGKQPETMPGVVLRTYKTNILELRLRTTAE